MRLVSLTLKNFRSYDEETKIHFDDLTALVGKNDAGKSTVLEALDLFFYDGKGTIRFDKADLHVNPDGSMASSFEIRAEFADFPQELILDTSNPTSLAKEYLLNQNGLLEISKEFSQGGSVKTALIAYHPTHAMCSDLMSLKNTELKKRIKDLNLQSDLTKNAEMRCSIRSYCMQENSDFTTIPIDIKKGDAVSIWENISKFLPVYCLFQADRANTTSDSEIQDPLKAAVKRVMSTPEIQSQLENISQTVLCELHEVVHLTLEKLKEMAPEIAQDLAPQIPSTESLKWTDVFKGIGIDDDRGIAINKRGSGVKRLILINFFRAEAERVKRETNKSSIIYAIEEPETSQHTRNQEKLAEALIQLSLAENNQVIITTHSNAIVKKLKFSNLRLVDSSSDEKIRKVEPNVLAYPSLNEVNFLAFGTVTEEYHNELYGYLHSKGLLTILKNSQKTRNYMDSRKKNDKGHPIHLSLYVRHQIHHPENQLNPRYSSEDLCQSIDDMRRVAIEARTKTIS